MVWTATHTDLQLSGLNPAACRPDAREVQTINLQTGAFQVDGHGFTGGEQVRFSPGGNPSPMTALPSGLGPGWYPVAATNGDPDFFSVTSPTAPFAPVVPSDVGRGNLYVVENYLPKIDRIMAEWTSVLVAKAVAYAPPWLTPPSWAPMMVAKLAAPTVAAVLRVSKDRYPTTDLAVGYEWAQQELRFLESGGIYNDGTGPIDSAQNSGTAATARAHSRRPWGFTGGCL